MSETDRSAYGFIRAACREEKEDKFVYRGRKMTAGEVFREVGALARFLVSVGVQRGDVVTIALPNIPDAAIAFYAVNAAGCVADVVHPRIGPEKLVGIAEETGARVAFLHEALYKKAGDALREKGIRIIVCDARDYAPHPPRRSAGRIARREAGVIRYAEARAEEGALPEESAGEETAVYLHSSGTTGEPKTVRLSNRALNESAASVYDTVIGRVPDADGEAMLMALPMFHGFGLGICLHLTMRFGKIVFLPRFRAKDAVRLMKKHKIGFLALVPGMLRRLTEERGFARAAADVRYVFVGGDKMSAEGKEKAQRLLSKYGKGIVAEGFGMSETAGVTHIDLDGRVGSVGRPVRGVKQKILTGTGEEAGVNETGDLYLSAPMMMQGYLRGEDPFTTGDDGEKWLRTGDVGYVDEEGFFHYKGREKRLVKIGGINVYPQETEEAAESLPFVRASCAVRTTWKGKPALKLLVVTKRGGLTRKRRREIEERIEKRIFRYAVPKEIVCVNELRATPLGKPDYRYYEEQEQGQGKGGR